jgi:chemotaxis protein methyltransferase CheR
VDQVKDIELSIIEYRNIVKTIKDFKNFDFSDYALTSLKRRIENAMSSHGIRQYEFLLERIKFDEPFFQLFIQEISTEGTEMFRDPSLWRLLRDEIFPLFFQESSTVKFWLPFSVSGDELFTLAIVLKENNWLDQSEILVSVINSNILDRIKSGNFKTSKIETSTDNYNRYQGNYNLAHYYNMDKDVASRDLSLISKVKFFQQNINFDNSPQDIRFVLYRNQMIYFNQNLQDKVLKIIHEKLIQGGFLVIGIMEQLGIVNGKLFKQFNETEKVYRKA